MPRLLRTTTAVALGALLAALLTGCGIMGQALDATAAEYYNYMAGALPGKKYSSFLSPAYRRSLPRKTLEAIDQFKAGGGKKNNRARVLKKTDVRTNTLGSFGVTAPVDPILALGAGRESKWVRHGPRWYLYLGNDAEVKEYGPFPVQLRIPPPQQDASQDPDHPQ